MEDLKTKTSRKVVFKQLLCFMVVGAFGVLVNGVVYQTFMLTEIGRTLVFSLLVLNLLPVSGYFGDVTFAWCFGILAAFMSNFTLDRWWVFGLEQLLKGSPKSSVVTTEVSFPID